MTSLMVTTCIYSVYWTFIVSCHMVVLWSYYQELFILCAKQGDLLTTVLREYLTCTICIDVHILNENQKSYILEQFGTLK